jgi:hypothetical protein
MRAVACLLYLSIIRGEPVNVVARASFGPPFTSFVVAVCRAKKAESAACEVLGNHRRQSEQSWLELGLRLRH